jgi:hypothetical protein
MMAHCLYHGYHGRYKGYAGPRRAHATSRSAGDIAAFPPGHRMGRIGRHLQETLGDEFGTNVGDGLGGFADLLEPAACSDEARRDGLGDLGRLGALALVVGRLAAVLGGAVEEALEGALGEVLHEGGNVGGERGAGQRREKEDGLHR